MELVHIHIIDLVGVVAVGIAAIHGYYGCLSLTIVVVGGNGGGGDVAVNGYLRSLTIVNVVDAGGMLFNAFLVANPPCRLDHLIQSKGGLLIPHERFFHTIW